MEPVAKLLLLSMNKNILGSDFEYTLRKHDIYKVITQLH
jgi:hypothetical protein